MLYSVTISGYVKFMRQPWKDTKFINLDVGSGVITLRAEKSTRLPIRLPRIRPSFPLRRGSMFSMPYLNDEVEGLIPGSSLSTRVGT